MIEEHFKKMSQKSIKTFINEIFSKGTKRKFITNKTVVYQIDDKWRLDKIDLKDYGPENNRGYGKVFAIIEEFSKFGWKGPLKHSFGITMKDSFENNLISSKRKPNLAETDRGKKLYDNFFQGFLNNNNIKLYPRNRSFGSVFAKRFNRTITDLLKRSVLEKGDSNWIDVLPTITKEYNITKTFINLVDANSSILKKRMNDSFTIYYWTKEKE